MNILAFVISPVYKGENIGYPTDFELLEAMKSRIDGFDETTFRCVLSAMNKDGYLTKRGKSIGEQSYVIGPKTERMLDSVPDPRQIVLAMG